MFKNGKIVILINDKAYFFMHTIYVGQILLIFDMRHVFLTARPF
jgi:hypothetical protein